MKHLAPVARVSADDCTRMAAAFVAHRCDTRQAGQLYTAWRQGTRAVRERILAEPELFLKTQRQAPAAKPAAVEQVTRDLEMAAAILHRANRRLTEAMAEMTGAQREQTERQIESARRELARMAERISKEQEAKHAEPGATNRDSGTECARSVRITQSALTQDALKKAEGVIGNAYHELRAGVVTAPAVSYTHLLYAEQTALRRRGSSCDPDRPAR